MLNPQLVVREWQFIDAVLDNMISTEVVNGDLHGRAAVGRRIREKGWDQIAHGGDWPPADTRCAIELREDEGQLVEQCLSDAADIDEDLGEHETAAELRRIGELITSL